MKYCIYSSNYNIFSKEYVMKFFAFCAFVCYTTYILCFTYTNKIFTITNCMVYLFGERTHYYLFLAPLMIAVLSGNANFDEYSTYEIMRFSSIRSYAIMRIGRMIAMAILSMTIYTLAAMMLYFPVCSFTQSWTVFNDLRLEMGYLMISEGLYSFSGCSIILIQVAMTTLSFVTVGLILLLLKSCMRNKNLPTVIVIIGNSIVYLACHDDILPAVRWIFPYSHAFLCYANSKAVLAIDALYWAALITALIVGCLYAMEKKDYIANGSSE